jgi:putative ABC transport system permease protein
VTLASAPAELGPLIDRIRPMFPWRMPDAWGSSAIAVLHSKSVVKDVQPKLFALSTAALLLLLLATVVLFSIGPVLLLLRQRRESVAGRAMMSSQRTSRISLVLMGVELALATTLLVGAGLMGRTLWQLANVDSGIHATNIVSARVSAGPSRCANPDLCWTLLHNLNQTLLALPGVRSVNWSECCPARSPQPLCGVRCGRTFLTSSCRT